MYLKKKEEKALLVSALLEYSAAKCGNKLVWIGSP